MTLLSGKGKAFVPHANEEESVKIYNYFAEKGGNFIDTADIYDDSEEVLGRWLQTKQREDWIIATKVRFQTGKGVNGLGSSRHHIIQSVERSLKRLQTDHIDLYQVHAWDIDTPIEETFRSLDDLVRIGKVRYIGISNFTGYQLQKTVDLVKYMGWEGIACLQPQYNLMCRSTEWDLVPICQENGIGIIPWSPLAGGWLSGKVKADGPAENSRVSWAQKAGWKPTDFDSHNTAQTWKIIAEVEKVAKETGKSMAQVSLRWLSQKPGVTAPIIGARSIEQIVDNVGTIGWKLTAAQMKALDDVSFVQPPYPWSEFWNTRRNLGLG